MIEVGTFGLVLYILLCVALSFAWIMICWTHFGNDNDYEELWLTAFFVSLFGLIFLNILNAVNLFDHKSRYYELSEVQHAKVSYIEKEEGSFYDLDIGGKHLAFVPKKGIIYHEFDEHMNIEMDESYINADSIPPLVYSYVFDTKIRYSFFKHVDNKLVIRFDPIQKYEIRNLYEKEPEPIIERTK